MKKRHFLQAALALATAGLALTASAQDFPPKKTITMVVGFAAGGAADTGARIIAKKLGENIGASVVVDNRAGAGGNIAHQYTAQGPADGSLILFGSVGPLTIAQHMMKLPYDPVKDLAPITMGVNFPNVLVVGAQTGIKTFADFVAYAKKNPGKLDFASTGPGSASHLAGELFNQRAGIDMVHVPYKGGAPALQDLLGERIAAYFSAPPTAMPHIESGKLVPLATTGLTRPAYLPHIPTVAEAGLPGFEMSPWFGLVGPAGVSREIVERLNREVNAGLRSAEMTRRFAELGYEAAPGTPEQFAAEIRRDIERYRGIVTGAGIRAEL